MIEWLRQDRTPPVIELCGRSVPIALNRNPRAKRLTMRLAPDGSAVRITLPRWCREQDAVAFATARREWLDAQFAKVPQGVDPLERGTVRFEGRELAIDWDAKAARRPVPTGDAIVLGGPAETVSARLRRWLEAEALRFMADDLRYYCEAAGVPVPDLRLTRAGRRWGSCSSKGIVRINWRLVMAPAFVRRSVVAHEVAHLVHFDHSPAFHSLLAEIYPGGTAEADRWLKAHGRALYAEFA